MFMHIKAPDENVLAQLIPEVWWDTKVLYTLYIKLLFLVNYNNFSIKNGWLWPRLLQIPSSL